MRSPLIRECSWGLKLVAIAVIAMTAFLGCEGLVDGDLDDEGDETEDDEVDEDGLHVEDPIAGEEAAIFLPGSAVLDRDSEFVGRLYEMDGARIAFPGDTFVEDEELRPQAHHLGHTSYELADAEVYLPEEEYSELSEGFQNEIDGKYRTHADDMFPGDTLVSDDMIQISGERIHSMWDHEGYEEIEGDMVAAMEEGDVLATADVFNADAEEGHPDYDTVADGALYIPGDTWFPGDHMIPGDTFFPGDAFIPGDTFVGRLDERFPGDTWFPGDHLVSVGDDEFPGGDFFREDAGLLIGEHDDVHEGASDDMHEMGRDLMELLGDGGGIFVGRLVGRL